MVGSLVHTVDAGDGPDKLNALAERVLRDAPWVIDGGLHRVDCLVHSFVVEVSEPLLDPPALAGAFSIHIYYELISWR
jgi:hypothetical protein